HACLYVENLVRTGEALGLASKKMAVLQEVNQDQIAELGIDLDALDDAGLFQRDDADNSAADLESALAREELAIGAEDFLIDLGRDLEHRHGLECRQIEDLPAHLALAVLGSHERAGRGRINDLRIAA